MTSKGSSHVGSPQGEIILLTINQVARINWSKALLKYTKVFSSLGIKGLKFSFPPLAPSIFKLTKRSSGPFDPRRFARSSLALLLSFQLPLHGCVTSSAFTSRPRPRFNYPSPGKHRGNQPRSFPSLKQT